jgi:hypothetical protein
MNIQRNRGIIPGIILSIIGIFICLFVLGYFTTQHPFGLPNYKQSLKLECGLTVYAPKENANVSFPYKIYGYGKGCGWDPDTNGIIGHASILAQNGLMLGSVNLPATDITGGEPYYFEAVVNLPVSFVGEAGNIIIENSGMGFAAKRVVIPVKFVSN